MTINGEAVPRTFIVYFIQRYRSVQNFILLHLDNNQLTARFKFIRHIYSDLRVTRQVTIYLAKGP